MKTQLILWRYLRDLNVEEQSVFVFLRLDHTWRPVTQQLQILSSLQSLPEGGVLGAGDQTHSLKSNERINFTTVVFCEYVVT